MNEPARILIVEDDEHLLEMLETFLAQEGYETVTAGNGLAGLEAVEKHGPDLVITDINMPEMDGFELCKRLKKRGGFLPVVILTSLDDRESRLRGIESGADDYLNKPVDFLDLKIKLKTHLRAKEFYDRHEKRNGR